MQEINSGEHFNKGYKLLLILVVALFGLIALRLWHFQILEGQHYSEKAQQNLMRERSIYALRGDILDRKGNPLADSQPAYALTLTREACSDEEAALARISELTSLDSEKLESRYQERKDRVRSFQPLILESNLQFSEVTRLEAQLADNPCIQIMPRAKRNYPSSPVFSHLLGYVAQAGPEDLQGNPDLQPGDRVGKRGVELTLEDRLRGSKGKKKQVVDAQGRILREQIVKKPEPGETVQLTIDSDLQQHIWQRLGDKTGTVIVMDPSNGDLKALVSKPGYENNLFVEGISSDKWQSLLRNPKNPLQNRAIQSTYPPASVFKLITASSALSQGIISPEEELHCSGRHRVGDRFFHCWRREGHGDVDLKKALKVSCDTYFYKVGRELGIENISRHARNSGFQSRTGIELPYERKGVVPDPDWKLRNLGLYWQGGDTVNTSIGQGYTLVTPLQVTRYVSALVNGGYLLQPNLLLEQSPVKQGRIPLDAGKINTLTGAMRAAVEEPHGTAWRLRTPGATIGGKTGTAQVVELTEELREMELEEIPYEHRHHAWMASYGHKEGEGYVIVALIEHGGGGGRIAGSVVRDVYDYLFSPEDGS